MNSPIYYNWSHSIVKQFEIHQVSSNSFFALAVLLKSSDKLSPISLKKEVYNRPFSNKPFLINKIHFFCFGLQKD